MKNTTHARITQKSPAKAFTELRKNFPMKYTINDGARSVMGFDLSEMNHEKKIAEVIFFNNTPVQVRLLNEIPRVLKHETICMFPPLNIPAKYIPQFGNF